MILSIQPNMSTAISFKGLTGNTSSNGFDIGDGSMRYFEQTNYYPFKDETPEAIDKYVKQAERGYYGPGMEISRSVSVKEALPFTEKEYLDYACKPKGQAELTGINKFIQETLDNNHDISDIWKHKSPVSKTAVINKPEMSKLMKFLSKIWKKIVK